MDKIVYKARVKAVSRMRVNLDSDKFLIVHDATTSTIPRPTMRMRPPGLPKIFGRAEEHPRKLLRNLTRDRQLVESPDSSQFRGSFRRSFVDYASAFSRILQKPFESAGLRNLPSI